MKNYVLLCHPGMNRVYAKRAAELCAKELCAVAESISVPISSVERSDLAGADCLLFGCPDALSERQLRSVARLSAFLILFERRPDGSLLPVAAESGFACSDDIVTQLKYIGKTNERFTHLMVHLAECACRTAADGQPCLLDPLCGKGTTLFTAMRFSMDSVGIEERASWVREAESFLAEYFERGKYKYLRKSEKRSDKKGRKTADIENFDYAFDKEEFRRKELRKVRFICADTLLAGELLAKRHFDFLVTDLPYGVQHGSKLQSGETRWSRNAISLVDEALDGWLPSLKPGASLIFAYNVLTTPGDQLRNVLVRHGLTVLTGCGYTGYEHRVDRSIKRDILVARKP